MKKFAPFVLFVALIASVALAARYEELIVGLVKCTSISDQAGANTSTPAQIAAAVTSAGTAVQPDATTLLTEGYFDVVNTTQLVFIATGVTNVIDADITN